MLVKRKHSAILAGAIAVSLLWTSSALAQDTGVEPGFYVGAGITQSRWDADNFDVDDLDDEDNSWKAIAGYRFNPNFARGGQLRRLR